MTFFFQTLDLKVLTLAYIYLFLLLLLYFFWVSEVFFQLNNYKYFNNFFSANNYKGTMIRRSN